MSVLISPSSLSLYICLPNVTLLFPVLESPPLVCVSWTITPVFCGTLKIVFQNMLPPFELFFSYYRMKHLQTSMSTEVICRSVRHHSNHERHLQNDQQKTEGLILSDSFVFKFLCSKSSIFCVALGVSGFFHYFLASCSDQTNPTAVLGLRVW